MIVSLDQAIEMHAKAALFRAGKSACKQTLELAERFRARGDLASFETWKSVSERIAELETKQGFVVKRRI
jgi:hypothetical protein